MSGPVSSGFTSAVALIILSSQVKDLFGITASGNTFIEMWQSIFEDIDNIRAGDTIMGVVCIIVLLLMRVSISLSFAFFRRIIPIRIYFQMIPNIKVGPTEDDMKTTCHKVVNKTLWLIGTARNAIIVIVCGGIGAAFYENGKDYVKMIGDIPPGLPSFQAPPFSVPEIRNETSGEIIQEAESFGDMLSNMGSGLIVIPLIALLENIAICKAFGE